MFIKDEFAKLTQKIFSQRSNYNKKKRKKTFVETLRKLEIYENDFTVFAVAGTNGKSSTTQLLGKAFAKHYKKVGTFTSPHVLTVNERIRINNHNISDFAFIETYKKVSEITNLENFGFFEVMTLLALFFFRQNKIDFCILECGIGALWDCVNYIPHQYAALTSISKDHEKVLGHSYSKITNNKKRVADKTKVFFWTRTPYRKINLLIEKHLLTNDIQNYCFQTKSQDFFKKNISFVNFILKKVNQEKNIIKKHSVEYRFSRISNNIYVDPAHNIEGLKHLIFKISETFQNKCTVVVGINKEKKWKPMVSLLSKQLFSVKYVTFDSSKSLQKTHKIALTPLSDYLKTIDSKTTFVFTGSFYFIGNVLKYVNDNQHDSY